METKPKTPTWVSVAMALLAIIIAALSYYVSRDAISLYGRFSLDEDDPIFQDAKVRFKKDHFSYIEGAGDELRAIGVFIGGEYCVKFYSSRPFSYSKNVPLFCYERVDGKFLRQLG